MKWIKCSERMPDPNEHSSVLAYAVRFGGEEYFNVSTNELLYNKNSSASLCFYVTHWMPLPVPNLNEKQGNLSMNIIEKTTEFSRDFEFAKDQVTFSSLRGPMLRKTISFLHEEIGETIEAIDANDREEIIDGFGDVAFIALNGIYKEFRTAGDDHETAKLKTVSVMHRICEANLAKKHPDGSIIYKNGKVQKPEGWRAPTYGDLL